MSNNKEKQDIIQKVNDDLLTLAMLDFILEEDEILEQERLELLKNQDSFPSFEQKSKFRKAVRKEIKKAKNTKQKSIKHLVRIAAVIVMCAITVGSLAVNAEAIRIKLFELIRKNQGIYSSFETQEYDHTLIKQNEINAPEYIPKGYEIEHIYSEAEIKVVEYKNENGENIIFTQNSLDNNIHLDTEDAAVEDILINGINATFIQKGGKTSILWTDDNYVYIIETSISKKELIKMAKSVPFHKSQ